MVTGSGQPDSQNPAYRLTHRHPTITRYSRASAAISEFGIDKKGKHSDRVFTHDVILAAADFIVSLNSQIAEQTNAVLDDYGY